MRHIGLIDAHEIFRLSLKTYLERSGLYDIHFEVPDRSSFSALSKQTSLLPNMIIVGCHLPVMESFETVKALKSQFPLVKIVLLVEYLHNHTIGKMFLLGVDGIVMKSSSLEDFSKVISNAFDNVKTLSNGKGGIVPFTVLRDRNGHLKSSIVLSEKQIRFLQLCAVPEYTYKRIADILELSPKTIDRYRDGLFKKLNITSRIGLALYAYQNGFVDLSIIGNN